MARTFDAVSLEILWNRLINITDEAATALVRTSFSPVIREFHDYACALFDRRGRLVAHSTFTTPGLLGILPPVAKNLCASFPPETLEPGDVLITNDPWLASGHLIDITVGAPIFRGGAIVGYCICVVHHLDIGGRMATLESRDIYEEGLKIPPSKLYRAGRESEDIVNFVRANVRAADKVVGDLRAQVAANHVAMLRLAEFLEDLGWDDYEDLADAIIGRTDAAMREAIDKLPRGRYAHELFVERVHQSAEPIRLAVAVATGPGEITVDFTGTSGQVAQALNATLPITKSYTMYALKCLLNPAIPNNEGAFLPVRVEVPEGSILNARWPAPTWGRTIIIHYIPEVIFFALAEAVPDKVIGGSGSIPLWYGNMAGQRRDGRRFLTVIAHQGGLGATAAHDGVSCLSFPGNVSNIPVEIAESDAPILYERKALWPDSGGAGRHRGGLGQRIAIRIPEDEIGPGGPVVLGLRGGRSDYPIPGLFGGRPGARAEIRQNGEVMRSGRQLILEPGDLLECDIPGGGGRGAPGERPVEQVVEDVREGYVTAEAAAGEYGVTVENGTGRRAETAG